MFGLEKFGMPEIVIIAVVLLIIFGPKKLPELAKGIKQAVREMTSGFKDTKVEKKKK